MGDIGWVFVDDRDPEISYGPSGTPMLQQEGVAREHLQTTTGLNSGNTLTYYFNASSISVYGTGVPTGELGPPVALYEVDYTPTTTVTGPRFEETGYHQEFWTSDPLPLLPPGALHKLVVTAVSPNNTVWFDYLAYPPSSNSTTNVTSTSSPAFSTSTTPAGTRDSAGTSNTKINTGVIIMGAVVGILAFSIMVTAALIYLWRWRSRATSRGYLKKGEVDNASDISHGHQAPLARSGAESIASKISVIRPDEEA